MTRKVGRPKGSKNKKGAKVGRPKGSKKPLEEIRKNSFSIDISDIEKNEVRKVRELEEFKGLNNRKFFMEMIRNILNNKKQG